MHSDLDYSVLDPANAAITLRGDLKFTPCEFDGEGCYLIEDPLRAKFFRIGSDEFALISLLDGKTSITQAIAKSAEVLQERAFVENEAMSVCHWLLESQLATCGGAAQGDRLATSARKQARIRMVSSINPMAMRLPLLNPDKFLSRIAPWCQWAFTRPAVIGWAIVCLIGMLVAAGHRVELVESSSVLLDRDNWLKLALAWLVLKLLHESAHAVTCLHFGGTVPSAGVLLVLFTPLPFVDVTASWRFPSKWQRIATAAAGMYIEVFLASLALIVWSWTTNPILRHAMLNIAATAGLGSIAINGNPLMRFDGYYMLSDWLELPNLSASGQKYIASLFQRMLGLDPPAVNHSRRARRIIAIYGVSAVVWRAMVYAGLLLVLYAMAAKLGNFVAVVAVTFTIAAMLFNTVRGVVKYLLNQPALSMRRLWALGGAGVACIGVAVFVLMRPGTIRTCGIVDYSPPTIVRSGSPGFVEEVKVRDGETVKAGQALIVMRNRELQVELADLRTKIEQSVLGERMLRQNGEIAKAQAEAAKGRSLAKKAAEIKSEADSLVIRAPAAGMVVAHGLESLPGRYLALGDPILVIGDEQSKEVILAAAQDDINSFLAQRTQPVTVRVTGDESNAFEAALTKIDPRASLKLPHPALGADSGGSLPVRPKHQSPDSKTVESELVDPCFSGTVVLDAPQSALLRAGQRATILFSSAEQSWAARLVMKVRKWIDDRLASAQQ
jgi:putative peptide zinc metalloprotease protein